MNNFLNRFPMIEENKISSRKMNNFLNRIEKINRRRNLSQLTFDFNRPEMFGSAISIVDKETGEKHLISFIDRYKSKDIYEALQIPKEISDQYFDILKYSMSTLIGN